MKCPKCESDVSDSADLCFNCGHALRTSKTLIRGSLVDGRFEILAPLGKGGMGMVYKARDHKLEETVAIKVLRSDVSNDPDMERRFRTEIRLARKVRHRNVCGIHEYGDAGGLRYIAMEYIEGVDLRKVLVDTGPLAVEQAFDVCIHVAGGLQAIHDVGIVHRDLKTANLMQDKLGVVRLMDFGIAKQLGAEATLGATATGLVVGTPEYMSPEQAQGGKIDTRSDIYAMGIVAFELFTGRVPFRGETPLATIFMHIQEPPLLEGPGAPPLPPSVVPVLRRALEKKADDRYATAGEFAQAMASARDAEGIAPLAPGPQTPRPSGGTTPLPMATLLSKPRTGALPRPATGAVATPTRIAQTRIAEAPPTRIAEAPSTRVLDTPRPTGRRPAASASRTPLFVVVGAAAVLLLGGGVALFTLMRGTPAPSPEPTSAPVASVTTPSTPAASAAPGTLVIDALPWGEVIEVVDAQGRRQKLPEAHDTPLALSLAPGSYTIEVRNPGFGSQKATVSVRAADVARKTLEFRRVDASEYLRRSGL